MPSALRKGVLVAAVCVLVACHRKADDPYWSQIDRLEWEFHDTYQANYQDVFTSNQDAKEMTRVIEKLQTLHRAAVVLPVPTFARTYHALKLQQMQDRIEVAVLYRASVIAHKSFLARMEAAAACLQHPTTCTDQDVKNVKDISEEDDASQAKYRTDYAPYETDEADKSAQAASERQRITGSPPSYPVRRTPSPAPKR